MNQQQVTENKQDHQLHSPSKVVKANEHVHKQDHPLMQAQNLIGNHGVLQRYGYPVIQAKLKIGEPNDVYEQEADRVADEVMRMPDPQVQRKSPWNEDEEDDIQMKPITEQISPIVQRKGETEHRDEEDEDEPIQMKNAQDQTSPINPKIESQIRSMKGGGEPLPKSVRSYYESRFGYDFSSVRVHKDIKAAESAKALKSLAFTSGSHVFFNAGLYEPQSENGKRLLSHELTHVLQQNIDKTTQLQRKLPEQQKKALSIPKKEVSAEEFNIEKKMNACWRLLDRIKDSLGEKKTSWDIAYRTQGSAYFTAYKLHEDAVNASAKEEAIKEAIAFGILTAISVGALGWLGEAAQAGKLGARLQTQMAGGLEDAIQSAVGEAIDVIQMKVTPAGQIISKHPFLYQNQLLKANDTQWKEVQNYLNKVRVKLEKRYSDEPQSLLKVDLNKAEQRINNFLKYNQMMNEPKKQDEIEMARELERSFWKEWAPRLLKMKINAHLLKYGIVRSIPDYNNPGVPVEKRLDALGITKAAGIGDKFGWWTFDSDIEKFISWSKKFQPKEFKF